MSAEGFARSVSPQINSGKGLIFDELLTPSEQVSDSRGLKEDFWLFDWRTCGSYFLMNSKLMKVSNKCAFGLMN